MLRLAAVRDRAPADRRQHPRRQPPAFSAGHPLGTDQVGNDIWSRLLYGGRNSLEIALAVQLIGLVLGGRSARSPATGGPVDTVIMRVLDVLIAFPSLVLALAIAQSLGPSKLHTIFALSFFSVPAFARISRGPQTLRLREQTFMLAARLSGTRAPRILLRHVAPNILPQLVTFGLLGMGVIIILEGALSFLGLGVPPPAPSWGNMISDGQAVLSAEPRLVLLPSAFLFVTVLAFNLLGDALRARWSAA